MAETARNASIAAQPVPWNHAPKKRLATKSARKTNGGRPPDLKLARNAKPSKQCQAVLFNPELLQKIVHFCGRRTQHALAAANKVLFKMVGKLLYTTLAMGSDHYSARKVFDGLDERWDEEVRDGYGTPKARLLRMVRTLIDPGHDECDRDDLRLGFSQMTKLHTLQVNLKERCCLSCSVCYNGPACPWATDLRCKKLVFVQLSGENIKDALWMYRSHLASIEELTLVLHPDEDLQNNYIDDFITTVTMGSSSRYDFYFIHHPPDIDISCSPFRSIGSSAATVLNRQAGMISNGKISRPIAISFKTASDYLKEGLDDELDDECLAQLRRSQARIGSNVDEGAEYRDSGKPYYGRPIWKIT
ncbi:hypothetical protein EHS25_008763 [Saitozyma podzolica]|uniref:Uncharacterized protein n=1 Tax=Saitozyma podzolica TaxID=1890683 RepID=A0A427YMJ3_9TREE|nr:hypothetical protein EHS25_008763 [Saitozyma podzolica]